MIPQIFSKVFNIGPPRVLYPYGLYEYLEFFVYV